MPNTIIKVSHLSKRYRIGASEQNKTFREAVMDSITAPIKNLTRLRNLTKFKDGDEENIIWAVKDVSFEVDKGEVLGIIGRNGSGKTTLLKLLSRITEPTSGFAEIHGRVSSLLEVGTGFHPELTGRENIFLNGAILGMRKQEIERKFDEIVAFSEIDKFIDTPVKRYSSGMYVRLAFAVAAHLEPEILLVDEVLAVGDIGFQKKCLGKIGDIAKGGRTVLLVSHNMGSIDFLCDRAILLDNGRVVMDGSASKVTREYSMSGRNNLSGQQVWSDIIRAPGDEFVRLRSIRSLNQEEKVCTVFDVRDPIILEIEYQVLKEIEMCAHFELFDELGRLILTTKDNLESPWSSAVTPKGVYRARCYLPGDFFNNGHIAVNPAIITGHHKVHVLENNALALTIEDRLDPDGVRGKLEYEWSRAAVRPRFHWTVEQEASGEKASFSYTSSD